MLSGLKAPHFNCVFNFPNLILVEIDKLFKTQLHVSLTVHHELAIY